MAWTATPKEITKDENGTGLILKVEITDGVYTETLTRPMFRPKLSSEVDETAKNIIEEVKSRKKAIEKVNLLYEDAVKKVNKPISQRVVAEVK
jgi:hypothetical protein